MSIEPGPHPQNDFASLQSCLVESSGEQRAREKRIRRRALVLSIAAQSAALIAIVLIPLFGKPERLAFAMTPIPPYYHAPESPATTPRHLFRHRSIISETNFYQPVHISQHIDEHPQPSSPEPPGIPSGPGPGVPCSAGCISIVDTRVQPTNPGDVLPRTPRRVFKEHLEPAMLIKRIEPVYPPLARQIRRQGRVELHAIIATDGSIQSLQVVDGDPLFVQSALDAVRQWRYRPTVLNGQPVEIDTHITVIYTLQQ